nr:LysR family transcriptional regulator [Raoultella sp. NCTC 9187]
MRAGLPDTDTNKGPVFVDSNGVLEAALAGKGIALIRSALVREELKNGTLINPLRVAIESPIAYYLVYDESRYFAANKPTIPGLESPPLPPLTRMNTPPNPLVGSAL